MFEAVSASTNRIADQVYRKLRKAIIDGELPARVRLVEVDIAARLEVSRTPVREAIARLINERLVTPLQYGGVEVADVTHDIEDICAIREALEGTAAQLAAERITPQEIEHLRDLLQQHCALPANDFVGRSQLNNEFHGAVLRAARAPRLSRMVEDFRDFFVQASQLTHYQKRHTEKALKQHEELIAALAARDGKKAEKITRLHLRYGMERMLELRRRPRPPTLSF